MAYFYGVIDRGAAKRVVASATFEELRAPFPSGYLPTIQENIGTSPWDALWAAGATAVYSHDSAPVGVGEALPVGSALVAEGPNQNVLMLPRAGHTTTGSGMAITYIWQGA